MKIIKSHSSKLRNGKSHSPKLASKNGTCLQANIEKTKRVASNKKYYIVSGECFDNISKLVCITSLKLKI